MSINKALLIKTDKVTVPAGDGLAYNSAVMPHVSQLAAFCAEHGYGFSEDLTKAFCRMTPQEFEITAKELVSLLSEMTQDVLKHAKTFYKNFPSDPENMTEMERLGFQLAYYLFGDIVRDYLPPKRQEEPEPVPLKSKSKILSLGTETDVQNLYRRMMASPVSMSDQDKEFLQIEFQNRSRRVLDAIPDRMPNKENMAFVSAQVLRCFREEFLEKCEPHFHTVTDVLRLIAYLNGYSVGLEEERWALKALSRPDRKLIFALIEKCENNIEPDMRRNIDHWKSVAYRYHPFDFVRSEKTRAAFDHLYQDALETSFSAKVEKAVVEKNIDTALKLLSPRPGEFVRRLDALFAAFPDDTENLLQAFEKIPAEKFEPRLLLQLAEHFKVRKTNKEVSIYLPKGGRSGIYAKTDDRLPVRQEVADRVCEICREKIIRIYSSKPSLGKVYIDDAIRGYKVPLQQRNNSKMGVRTPAKGSRIQSDPQKDIVRTYIWWTNTEKRKRVDVDLSLKLYNENLESTGSYYYGNFYRGNSAAVSSGDITDGGAFGGKGAAEFLDFSRSKLLETGTRYVQVCVNVFTCQRFHEFPCKFGYMQRDELKKKVPFEPSTIESNIDITSDSTNYTPVVYDVKTGEFIWVDVTGMGRSGRISNVEGQTVSFNAALYMAVHNEIPDLYDLVFLNAKARGQIVDTKEEADVICSLKEGITPYDLDVISADLLAKEVTAEITGEGAVPEETETEEKSEEDVRTDILAENPDEKGSTSREEEEFIRFLLLLQK